MRIFISGLLFSSAAATLCSSPCRADQTCDNGLCRKKNKCDDVICGPNSECLNKTGACQCSDGFAQTSQGNCIINPCESMSCHSKAKCSLTENSSNDFVGKCECVPGKVGDGVNLCAMDFCGTDRHKCGLNAVCETLGEDYSYNYECFCEDGYVANGSKHGDLGGSGYRTPCQEFRCDEKLIGPLNENYEIVVPTDLEDQDFSWTAAQQICREKGPFWDLAIIDNDNEHKKVMALTNCAENAFWIGVQKDDMGAPWETVLRENANMLNKWQIDEPKISEKNLCVKMHLGKFNTGNCKSTIHGSKKVGTKMGYICEKHARRVREGVQCESKNDRVAPFKTLFDCPKPTCLGKNNFQIIDAWKRKTQGSTYAFLYGFSALITLGKDAFDENGGAVMLRFANGNTQGNLQTYNLNFFGFYNNNNDVLFHTKWWANGDRKDQNSVLVTVENINTPDYPEVFYWNYRINQHNCFQSPLTRTRRPPMIVSRIAAELKPDLRDTDDIHTISFKGGEIKRIRNN